MKNYTITVNGNVYDVVVEEGSANGMKATPEAPKAPVISAPAPQVAKGSAGAVLVKAGAAGKVFKIESKIGDSVKSGDTIVVIEAMKMEIPVVAPLDGVVASIDVTEGQMIESGAVLVTLD